MIQAKTQTSIIFTDGLVVTEDNRIYDVYQSPAAPTLIGKPVPTTQIRHLFKFINQMDKSVQYAYNKGTILDRYTSIQFDYVLNLNVNSVYNGQTSFNMAGTYVYEVYEVAWNGTVSLSAVTAPATETQVLEPADTAGVVMGLCTKGIMMVSDKDNTAQVQYTQREEPSGTNYIYYGQ
tara:strand:+ start:411 stop:944 length:534 start_codon:yes stop_codon:yes gene_type:complete